MCLLDKVVPRYDPSEFKKLKLFHSVSEGRTTLVSTGADSSLHNSPYFQALHLNGSQEILGGGNSNIFYSHPYLGKMNPI